MTDYKEYAKQMRENAVKNEQGNIVCSPELWEEIASVIERAILPPCKVGDIVYVIEPCSCFSGYRTFEECHKRRTNATKWIEAVMVANKHHNRCMKLFERPYKPEYYFKIGKTVFLTKEEAEQKLEELNNGAL